jgi:hypothetical protein
VVLITSESLRLEDFCLAPKCVISSKFPSSSPRRYS